MVRQVINSSGSVVNFYTYEPFGKSFATGLERMLYQAKKLLDFLDFIGQGVYWGSPPA